MSVSSSTRRTFRSSDRALGAKSINQLLQVTVRGEELDLGRSAQRRLRGRKQRGGLITVVTGEVAGRCAELDRDAVRIVGVDRRTPAVVDAHAVETEVEPPFEADLVVVEVDGVERDVIRPRGESEPGR